jgi:hypothetical protein
LQPPADQTALPLAASTTLLLGVTTIVAGVAFALAAALLLYTFVTGPRLSPEHSSARMRASRQGHSDPI